MVVKLKEIAFVQMGLSFRARLEPDPDGEVSVIQMKDLTEDNRLDDQDLVRVDMRGLKAHHRVEKNDLAFRSRGQTNTAALLDVDLNAAVIAAPLLRIRVKDNSVMPAYLCWFINQASSQSVLRSKATGAATRIIGKPVLEDIEVVLPALDIQQKIIALNRLSVNEQTIMKALADKKALLMAGMLMQLAAPSSAINLKVPNER